MQNSQQLGSTSALNIGNPKSNGSVAGNSLLKSASAPALKPSKKKVPSIGALDHNNFTAGSDPSKHEKNTPMIKKSSIAPPIRSFDGDIVVVKKGPPVGKTISL